MIETKVSFFTNTSETEVFGTFTIEALLKMIKNGDYGELIDKVRGGEKELKKKLPTIAFHGTFEGYRKKANFVDASGLIILDIDNVDLGEIEESKMDIMESSDHVLAVMVSPSGNGIKVLYYVQPYLVTADNYRQIGKQLISEFDIYGDVDFLSVTDCLIMTYDPKILINEEVIPAFLYIKEVEKKKAELEELDKSKTLWEDAEEFFETVLAMDIEAKTSNNFHYIQISMLDLAKFGFTHPAQDLSFVVDYAEEAIGVNPANKKRFLEVAEVAKQYPQTQWPYRLVQEDDFYDDEEMDYSALIEPKETSKNDDLSDSKEEKTDGLISYPDFFDRVLDVAKQGDRVGFEISLSNFAEIFRFKGSGILTITGIPSHGKSEWVDACIIDLARLYGHGTIICGYEQTPEEHTIKLVRKVIGRNVTCKSYLNKENMSEFKQAYDFVTSHIKHIDTVKIGGNINKVLEVAVQSITEARENGRDPKYVVIDPFNMLSIKSRVGGHEKIEEILRRITHFSHQMNVLVILVAHPFKMKKDEKTGKYEVPDFYSVKGSSAFFEMSYHGLVVYRTGYKTTDLVFVKVLKVKQNNLGDTGEKAFFTYDKQSGRYIPCDEEGNEISGDHWDKNWISKNN